MYSQTDDTADDHRYKTSIDQKHMHLSSFTEENQQNLGCTFGFRALKVNEFLVKLIVLMDADPPSLFTMCQRFINGCNGV